MCFFSTLICPAKNGFECLCEIKEHKSLKVIPVVMFSTSYPRDQIYEANMINTLLKIGAHHFIRKPGDFAQLKQVIHQTLTMFAERKSMNSQVGNL